MGFVVIAAVFLPRPGLAHTPGVSMADLTVAPDGRVDARLTFAATEMLGASVLRREDLASFVLDGVEVRADGARCEPRYGGSSLNEGDALLLEASYACDPGAASIDVTFFYLSTLPPGHRAIARIVGPPGSGAIAETVLTRDHRALSLTLPAAADRPSVRSRRARVVAVTAIFTVLMLALFVWRWRATRKRPVKAS
jgi:hypothetical protein